LVMLINLESSPLKLYTSRSFKTNRILFRLILDD